MVLIWFGIEWLQTLGPILSDFSVPYLKFTHLGQQIILQGKSFPLPQIASFQLASHLVHMDSVAFEKTMELTKPRGGELV